MKILEAKLALEKDPNWLATNSVIGLHQISNEQLLLTGDVTTGNLGQPIDLKEVEDALIYQLHERLEFIKPPEGVVANLLFDLSRILARRRSPEHASSIKNFAETYGPELTPWSVADIVVPAVELPPPISMTPYWIAGGLAFAALALSMLMLLIRGRRRTA